MNQVLLKYVVQFVRDNGLTLKQAALDPADLATALLVNQQPGAEFLGLDLEEAGELLQIHRSVEFQVGPDGGVEEGVSDLIHEDGGVVVNGVDVEGRVVEVGRGRADELGAGGAEEFLEERQGLGAAALEADELFTVFLAEGGVDGVVEAGWVESDADGDQGVHLVVLLGDGVVAVAALVEVLGPRDVHQDVAEHADGVGVAAHHHVGEAHVVVCGEVGGHDAGEHGLLVHLDVVEGFECKAKISQQAVDAQQTDDREVSQHPVQRAGTVFSSICHRVLATLDSGQLVVDLRPLDQRVENIEHGIAAPSIRILAQKLGFLLIGPASGNTVAVSTERLKLVNKLIDNIPCPEVLNQSIISRRKIHQCFFFSFLLFLSFST